MLRRQGELRLGLFPVDSHQPVDIAIQRQLLLTTRNIMLLEGATEIDNENDSEGTAKLVSAPLDAVIWRNGEGREVFRFKHPPHPLLPEQPELPQGVVSGRWSGRIKSLDPLF